jgi:hypothetical protein
MAEPSVARQLKEFEEEYSQFQVANRKSAASSRHVGFVGDPGYDSAVLDAANSSVVPSWCPAGMPLLAITCSTNEPLPRILQWIRYHQLVGFSLFYFFVEGKANEPEVVDVLRTLVGVKVCV